MCAKRRIAIKALLALALTGALGSALAAQVAGTVINLSGALLAKKADGKIKVLGLKSEVEQGDTLMSEKNTYAQIKFIDNSEITLKPNTTFKVEAFAYEVGKPEGDSASFSLVKGGLRSVTGLLGKRNKEKFSLKTPSATIGIRGTTFVAEYVEEDAQAVAARTAFLFASVAGLGDTVLPARPLQLAQGMAPPKPGAPGQLTPGLHVFVIDGMITMSNAGGNQMFTAGQFGFVRNNVNPPVLVPNNPALKFSPPPAFTVSNPNAVNQNSTLKPDTVDCEVR